MIRTNSRLIRPWCGTRGNGLTLVLALLLVCWSTPRITVAQDCGLQRPGLSVLASASHARQAGGAGLEGWGLGARLEWTASTQLSARGSYRNQDLAGAMLHVAGLGLAWRLPVPGQPCVTADALLAFAGSLNPGDDFRNFTAPVALVFQKQWQRAQRGIGVFGGIEGIYSGTNAELLSFPLQHHAFGVGALSGLRAESGRAVTVLSFQLTSLPASIGPQPLGRFRADLAVGFRL
jgi:hypothetical protein